MASSQTTNYSLPQWSKSDRIQMSDFNTAMSTIDAALTSIVPSGVIALWSGAANAIPSGWTLCDGTNGTPDLRGRFLVGAGGDYAVGATGGAASDSLTSFYRTSGSVMENFRAYPDALATHDNRPPYYALCYIMRL